MEDIGAIIVGRFPLASGEWIPPHSHTRHQLAWTRRGVLSVGVGEVYWILPPTRALWLPAGVTHATGATRDAVLCSLYLAPERCPLDWPEPTAVGVDGLLAELIGYLSRTDLTDDARLRAEAVVPDLLRPLPTRPIDVPQPTDERVQVVASALLADPADQHNASFIRWAEQRHKGQWGGAPIGDNDIEAVRASDLLKTIRATREARVPEDLKRLSDSVKRIYAKADGEKQKGVRSQRPQNWGAR